VGVDVLLVDGGRLRQTSTMGASWSSSAQRVLMALGLAPGLTLGCMSLSGLDSRATSDDADAAMNDGGTNAAVVDRVDCGSLSDGCGGTDCSTCTSPQTCDGGGTANGCGASGPLAFVQSAQNFMNSSPSITISLSNATHAGDLLIVGTTVNNTTDTVSAISDNMGNAYVSATQKATFTGNETGSSDVWYAKNIAAGVTSVTVQWPNTERGLAYVIEVSGASTTSPLSIGATRNNQASTSSPMAPAVSTSGNAFVVSVINVSNSVCGASPPFTGLPVTNANDLAYAHVTTNGSYGASFAGSNVGQWCATTVAFH
jgi:hypothetical protein